MSVDDENEITRMIAEGSPAENDGMKMVDEKQYEADMAELAHLRKLNEARERLCRVVNKRCDEAKIQPYMADVIFRELLKSQPITDARFTATTKYLYVKLLDQWWIIEVDPCKEPQAGATI